MNESYFLEADMDAIRWEFDMDWRQLQEPRSKSDWRGHSQATSVNAFYSLLNNVMGQFLVVFIL